MTGEQRDRVEQHVAAALDDDRHVGGPLPEDVRAQVDDELGDLTAGTPGCAVGCVMLIALLILAVGAVGGVWLLAGWL